MNRPPTYHPSQLSFPRFHSTSSPYLNQILCGDALETLKLLPDNLVHCVVTSPPYYGLRDYGTEKQIGLEETPELYISRLVEIFREVRRVLHSSGTLWLVLGDSYGGSNCGFGDYRGNKSSISIPQIYGSIPKPQAKAGKPKNLLMIPFRVAMALQEDGWWLRSILPYIKINPMPESVSDRPTSAIEYVFMLTKSPYYFYDAEAVRMPLAPSSPGRYTQKMEEQETLKPRPHLKQDLAGNPTYVGFNQRYKEKQKLIKMANTKYGGDGKGLHAHTGYFSAEGKPLFNPEGRYFRNSDLFFLSWQGLFTDEENDSLIFIMSPERFPMNWCPKCEDFIPKAQIDVDNEKRLIHKTCKTRLASHFAVFPQKLVEPCVKASTSERGVCPACGEPWVRIVEKKWKHQKQSEKMREQDVEGNPMNRGGHHNDGLPYEGETRLMGWKQNCDCEPQAPIPAIVLDPFIGSGTTAIVSKNLGRNFIGIDLSSDYCKMAQKRLSQIPDRLPLEVR